MKSLYLSALSLEFACFIVTLLRIFYSRRVCIIHISVLWYEILVIRTYVVVVTGNNWKSWI